MTTQTLHTAQAENSQTTINDIIEACRKGGNQVGNSFDWYRERHGPIYVAVESVESIIGRMLMNMLESGNVEDISRLDVEPEEELEVDFLELMHILHSAVDRLALRKPKAPA